MYRLLLHVGLPKTATTSLQRNVLMPLHEQRKIRFLGRYVRDSETFDRFGHETFDPFGHETFDPFAEVFERIKARQLSAGEIRRLRPMMEAKLDRTRLNVISNENIANTIALSDDVQYDILATLHNLGRLFRGDDVTVLISLRSPVDFVFSEYVEAYYWWAYVQKGYDTIERFCRQVLRHGPDSDGWIIFFYDAYVRAVARHFDRISVLLYEDLEHDPSSYFSQLAAGLQSEPEEIRRMFLQVRHNAGVHTRSGKLSRRPTVRHVIQKHFPSVRKAYIRCRPLLERTPALRTLCRRLASIDVTAPVDCPYPDGETRRRLQRRLGLRDDYLTRVHDVSEEKLARYGYLHPDHPRNASA